MSTSESTSARESSDVDALDVYWRPGCPFCMALRPQLKRLGVPVREHDIWSEDGASAAVRAVAGGNETVPTVFVGEHALVNPSALAVRESIHAHAPQLASQLRKAPWWQRMLGGK